MIQIELTDQQTTLEIDAARLKHAAHVILQEQGPPSAQLSIAVVDDHTIHQLNRQYLQHDYPTDVLSFVLECDESRLEGEVIVSADTAVTQSAEYDLAPADELLLYIVHGVLHLVGFDDKAAEDRQAMRAAEGHYLTQLGVAFRERGADM